MNAEKLVKLSEDDLMCIVGGGEETFMSGFIEGLTYCDMIGPIYEWFKERQESDYKPTPYLGAFAAGTIKMLAVFGAGCACAKRKEIANWFKKKFKK